jgi:hypothetical protein
LAVTALATAPSAASTLGIGRGDSGGRWPGDERQAKYLVQSLPI